MVQYTGPQRTTLATRPSSCADLLASAQSQTSQPLCPGQGAGRGGRVGPVKLAVSQPRCIEVMFSQFPLNADTVHAAVGLQLASANSDRRTDSSREAHSFSHRLYVSERDKEEEPPYLSPSLPQLIARGRAPVLLPSPWRPQTVSKAFASTPGRAGSRRAAGTLSSPSSQSAAQRVSQHAHHLASASPVAVRHPVLLTIRALGIDELVTEKEADLAAESSLNQYPSIDDDGFCLWNSHAIVTYLVGAYGKDDSLYPEELTQRSKVDQWLHFSSSVLYNRLLDITEPLRTRMSKVVSEDLSQRAESAFRMLEDSIGQGPWLCGEHMTVADLCCVSPVAAIEIFIGDSRHYPKMTTWVQHCQKYVPGYQDIVEACRQKYVSVITSKMTS